MQGVVIDRDAKIAVIAAEFNGKARTPKKRERKLLWTLRLSRELKRRIQESAKREGKTASDFVRMCVWREIERLES